MARAKHRRIATRAVGNAALVPETPLGKLLRAYAVQVPVVLSVENLRDDLKRAADELDRCSHRLMVATTDRHHWYERARSAEQALALYGDADVR